MNLFNKDETTRINKAKETNERLESFFVEKRTEWCSNVEPLFKSISLDLSVPSNSSLLLDNQSLALSYRQILNDEVNLFLNKRSRETSKLKTLKQDKFIFYATGFGIKTNMGEKTILIDGHIAENERAIELIESHIQFLRDTVKNLESLGFAMKNLIDLMNWKMGK